MGIREEQKMKDMRLGAGYGTRYVSRSSREAEEIK